jgi:Fur family iron response transcriptional regulator
MRDAGNSLSCDGPGPLDGVLTRAGITPTSQRRRIAALLLARPTHLSAEEILCRLEAEGGGVSKATVYNTLKLFLDRGLVREVIVDPSRVFYDSNTSRHHHFYNEDTGQLTDISTPDLQISGVPEAPPGTRTTGVDLIVRVRAEEPDSG